MEKPKSKTLARRVTELEVDLSVAYAHIAELQTGSAARLVHELTEALGSLPTKPALHKIRGRLHALEVETAAHVIVMKELMRKIDVNCANNIAAQTLAEDAHTVADNAQARIRNFVALVNDINNTRPRRKSRPKRSPKPAAKKRSRRRS